MKSLFNIWLHLFLQYLLNRCLFFFDNILDFRLSLYSRFDFLIVIVVESLDQHMLLLFDKLKRFSQFQKLTFDHLLVRCGLYFNFRTQGEFIALNFLL